MLNLLQSATRSRGMLSTFRHFGAFGLFFLTILDSSPIPTFGGADILLAILVATRPNPWFEYAISATLGSAVGAFLTFRIARKAGENYFLTYGPKRVKKVLSYFKQSASVTLIAVTAVPLPLPTSLTFAAAGVSGYGLGKFLIVVVGSRSVRYTAVALLAHYYGRPFVRVILHPTQHPNVFGSLLALMAILVAAGILLSRRLSHSN